MKKQIITLLAGATLLAGCAQMCGPTVHSCSVKRADFTFDGALFEFDSASLSNKAQSNLDKVVKEMKNSNKKAQINGYTDSTGNADYNVDLSQRRAQAVANYLTTNGIAKDRLMVKGYGATDFVADNDTNAGRAKNRRTEIIFK